MTDAPSRALTGAIHITATLLAVLASLSTPAAAQTAVLRGSVTDSATRAPLPSVRVTVLDVSGTPAARTVTDAAGRFVLASLEAGAYRLVMQRLGYRAHRVALTLEAGDRTVSIALAPLGLPIAGVVVSASRSAEAAIDAPASITVIEREEIEDAPAFTPVDHAATVPGLDIARKGLTQSTFAVRGDRSATSGAMLMLTDYRYAGMPSLGFNIPYLIPPTSDDLDRIEVMRGPGAALYGPNSHRGVLHFITRSPFVSEGTAATVTGGERGVLQGTVRHAQVLNESVAFKISGDYFRGDDWPSADTNDAFRRNLSIERVGGEARVDLRPASATTIIAAAGVAQALNNVDFTQAVGAVQVRDWRNSYVQARLERRRLSVNAMYNWSDAGHTRRLDTGARLVDRSRMAAAQVQHGIAAGRADLRYGFDARYTDPRTAGTIHGRYETSDAITEWGAYLHARAPLSPRLTAVAALRADYHDRLGDFALSPRLALVFQPQPAHTLRLTFNRAFNSPDPGDLFPDVDIATLGPFPYVLRLLGTPPGGFTLRRDCGGRMCMRSPFNPAGSRADLPADATQMWDALLDLVRPLVPVPDIPAPDPSRVSSDLRVLDLATGEFNPIAETAIRNIAPDRRTVTTAFELGYKGVIADRVLVGLDLYRTEITDLFGVPAVATPNVFFNRGELEQYLTGFMPPDDAARAAVLLSSIPAGTVAPVESANADLLLVEPQGGAAVLWGADVAVLANLTERLSVGGTYSWVSDDSIANVARVGTIVLNAPAHKGSLRIDYRDARRGLRGSVQGRAVAGFPVASGRLTGRVRSYVLADASFGVDLPGRRTTISLAAYNVLNNRHREFVATPEIGRLAVVRVRTEF